MSLWVDSQAARPKPEANEVTLSLVNSVSSRRAQKSGQDVPKLISRPGRHSAPQGPRRVERQLRDVLLLLRWGESVGRGRADSLDGFVDVEGLQPHQAFEAACGRVRRSGLNATELRPARTFADTTWPQDSRTQLSGGRLPR
jgi:hypothetical protein